MNFALGQSLRNVIINFSGTDHVLRAFHAEIAENQQDDMGNGWVSAVGVFPNTSNTIKILINLADVVYITQK